MSTNTPSLKFSKPRTRVLKFSSHLFFVKGISLFDVRLAETFTGREGSDMCITFTAFEGLLTAEPAIRMMLST